ncbi:MAG: PEP-CTERM sorting domain-containing protein [Gammaproteobacteria bacterium]|nr:PEP-CTERM sorting domain-containing protein [Gammaproteobacteria bacterium]
MAKSMTTFPRPLRDGGGSDRCRRVARLGAGLAPILFMVPVVPAGAWVIDQQSTVNITGSADYAVFDESTLIPIMDIAPSIPYGAGWGKVGLWAGAGGHADIDARFGAGLRSVLNLASKAQTRTVIIPEKKDPVVGDAFFLYNSIDSLGIQKLSLASEGVYGYADLLLDLGGWAQAKACLGVCISAKLGLKAKTDVSLARIDHDGLELFGQTVDESAPFAYKWPGGFAEATGNIPTFSKTFSNIGFGATAYAKQESMFSVKMDVAELVAKAAAFPIPLEGDLMGFGYELLSLDAYAGVNLRQDMVFKPTALQTVYEFSAPVEMRVNGTWLPLNSLFLPLGDEVGVELRSLNASALSITQHHRLNYDVDFDFDLVVNAGLELDALALHGFGLELGPLLNPDPWNLNLASLDLYSGHKGGTIVTTGGTSTLKFQTETYEIVNGEPVLTEHCLVVGGCSSTGYVTVRTDLGGGVVEEAIHRVTNYGDTCNDSLRWDCEYDLSFLPLVTQRQVTDIVDPLPWYDDTDLLTALEAAGIMPPAADWFTPYDIFDVGGDFAPDFAALGALLAANPLTEAPASDAAAMLDSLRVLGVDPDQPFPPHEVPTGQPYEALYGATEDRNGEIALTVPEPATPALLVVAGLAFGIARKQRAARRIGEVVA